MVSGPKRNQPTRKLLILSLSMRPGYKGPDKTLRDRQAARIGRTISVPDG